MIQLQHLYLSKLCDLILHLCDKGHDEKHGIDGKEGTVFVVGDDEAVDTEEEGVHAQHDHQQRHNLEVGRPEVKLVDVVELHLEVQLRYLRRFLAR